MIETDNPDMPLPALNPLVKLYKGPDKPDGTPTWTLHHPLSNKYFQIGWAEFECLARFHRCQNAENLMEAVKSETTVDLDMEDITSLLTFLHTNGLVAGADAMAAPQPEKKKQSFFMKLMHHYLFFTVPLFRPQKFLDASFPYVRPLFSKSFLIFSYLLLAVLLIMTVQRADEFLHTFFQLFSVQGAIMIAVVFTVIKILHELGHAYTATRYGVPVPHMGAAFIVLYPVLYTETTGAWQLSSRRARIHIGLAGIATELIIAAYALLLWHILPPGLGQSLAFSVVALSLIGSLLVNLNPLMRFDGYYVLSDSLGIENLHARAIAFARWRMRKFLFALDDPEPEDTTETRKKFLISFGFAVMIYRFFLFLGIALLVYYLFFQPLGFILMMVELLWFIGFPIWKELLVWFERRSDIFAHSRSYIVTGSLVLLMILCAFPIHRTVSVPAVYHAASYRPVYSPAPALIAELLVKEGDEVRNGDILARMESPTLQKEISTAEFKLENLQHLKRREQTDSELYRERRNTIDEDIEAAKKELESLYRRQDKLLIRAEFSGIVRDMPTDIHEGRSVKTNTLLFRLISRDNAVITGYLREDQLTRVADGYQGVFYPNFSVFRSLDVQINHIDRINTKSLRWPELSSLYAGPIASELFQDSVNDKYISPRQSLYAVNFSLKPEKRNKKQELIIPGQVKIKAKPVSPFRVFLQRLAALFLREANLNSI